MVVFVALWKATEIVEAMSMKYKISAPATRELAADLNDLPGALERSFKDRNNRIQTTWESIYRVGEPLLIKKADP